MGYKVKGKYGGKAFISPVTFKTKGNAIKAMKTTKERMKTGRMGNTEHYKKYKDLRVVKV